jgi:predicted metal-dependent peptidase
MITADHHHALSKAKIQLMAKPDSVFFTTVCFSLKHIWDDRIPTACTNGKEIRYNPKFFMSLNTEEQIFLMLHESMHVAYLHMDRLQTRHMRRWNIAADFCINLQLVQRGYKMPSMGLLDHKYDDMGTEEIYKLLPENPPQECDMDIQPGEGDPEQLAQDVQDILVRAQIQSKMAGDKPGTIPGDIQIYLDGLLNPVLPWNNILRKYINTFTKNDYSFRKPNRRFFPQYHLPSLAGEKLMNLAIAVDTSGSVSDHNFHVFVSEVAAIFRMMKPEEITLVQFDTEIKSVDKLKDLNDLSRCKFTGRGGTLIGPVLEWANNTKPQLLLVFSDGGFNFYDTQTKSETLWVIHNNPKWSPPWGKTIHYEVSQK